MVSAFDSQGAKIFIHTLKIASKISLVNRQLCFLQYHSGTELDTPNGSMHGSFQCVTLDSRGYPNDSLDARVLPFELRSPERNA